MPRVLSLSSHDLSTNFFSQWLSLYLIRGLNNITYRYNDGDNIMLFKRSTLYAVCTMPVQHHSTHNMLTRACHSEGCAACFYTLLCSVMYIVANALLQLHKSMSFRGVCSMFLHTTLSSDVHCSKCIITTSQGHAMQGGALKATYRIQKLVYSRVMAWTIIMQPLFYPLLFTDIRCWLGHWYMSNVICV